MIKRDELTNPQSCMSRAADAEMTFVLLGRDAAAPAAIRAWVTERVRLGKNAIDDDQVKEALHCAGYMEQQHRDRIGLEGTSEQAPPELELEQEADGRWIAEFLRFTGVMAYGKSPEEAIRNAAKVLIEPCDHFWRTIPVNPRWSWFTECEKCKMGAPLELQAENYVEGYSPGTTKGTTKD